MLSGGRPNPVPSQGKPIFGLATKLVLIKFVLFDKEDIGVLATKPCYRVSRAARIGRNRANIPIGKLACSATGGGSRFRIGYMMPLAKRFCLGLHLSIAVGLG